MADDRERDTEHTTVVTRDGGGRGGAGIVLVLALIVILLAVLFFSGVFDRNDEPELNVMVNSPDVNVIVPLLRPERPRYFGALPKELP